MVISNTIKMPAKNSTGKSKPAAKRAKKSTSAKTTSAPVPEPEVETVAPVASETTAPVASETTESVSSETTAPVSSTSNSVGSEQLEADYQSLMNRLGEFKTLYTAITSDLRKLQKNMNKYIRESNKRTKKPKNTDPNRAKRAPSGFAKPALISNELCSFLGVQSGTEMARTEVTKHLTTYIKEHNLQDQANKRKILPDSALQKLLNVSPSDEVTYFNLQKFMKVHFPKSASASSSSA